MTLGIISKANAENAEVRREVLGQEGMVKITNFALLSVLRVKKQASVYEPCSHIRSRYHALIFFSKPPVAVSGNPIVNEIADKNRDNFKYVKRRPHPVKVTCNFQGGIAFFIQLPFVNEQHTVE